MNMLKIVELLTFWYSTVLPSGFLVHCVTPRSVRFVIWVTAIVIGRFQNFFGELGDIITSVFVWGLAVPALTGLPGLGERLMSRILCTQFGLFATTGTCVGRHVISY